MAPKLRFNLPYPVALTGGAAIASLSLKPKVGIAMTLGLPSSRVWELAGVPPSTLHYWVRTRLVTPSIRKSQGKRVERWWTVDEAIAVRVIRALRTAGAPLQVVRKAAKMVREWDQDLAGVRMFWDGRDLVVLADDGETVSVRERPGQQILQLVGLPIGEWAQECQSEAEVVDMDKFRSLAKERAKRRRQRRKMTERAPLVDRLLEQADEGDAQA